MNLFNNKSLELDTGSGLAPKRDALTAAAKSGAASEAAASGGSEVAADGFAVFELLLSSVSSAAVDAAPETKTKSDMAAPASAATAPDLNLFLSLLPALTPTVAVMPQAAATGACAPAMMPPIGLLADAGAAVAPPATAAPTDLALKTDFAAALKTDMPALAASPLLAEMKTEEPRGAAALSPGKPTDGVSFDRVLMTLDRSFQLQVPATASSAVTVAGAPAQDVLGDLPMQHGEWPTALGHRLLWTVGAGIQQADIRVSPEHLGPIHVHIQVHDNKTDLQFTALHPLAREALETSIPRLREMFSQQGLDLMQAQVFSQTPQHPGGRQPAAAEAHNPAFAVGTAADETPIAPTPVRYSSRLIDDYA